MLLQFLKKMTWKSQNTKFFGNHIPLPPEWARLKSKPGTRWHCSVFGLLMSEAFLTSNSQSLSWPWSFTVILLSSGLELGKMKAAMCAPFKSLHFPEFWELASSSSSSPYSVIPRITSLYSVLTVFQIHSRMGEKSPLCWRITQPRTRCSVFMINVTFLLIGKFLISND